MCVIIPLTRNVEPLTRKGKQLTRKVGVKFYGFIFWLKQIFSGNSDPKNVLPTMRKHYRLAALLHDVFRKPHRQKVYLKPKYKAKTSRFLSTLRFLFGCGNRIRTRTEWVRVISATITLSRIVWCEGRDLNSQGITTRPSNVRVCRFRHPRINDIIYYTKFCGICQYILQKKISFFISC